MDIEDMITVKEQELDKAFGDFKVKSVQFERRPKSWLMILSEFVFLALSTLMTYSWYVKGSATFWLAGAISIITIGLIVCELWPRYDRIIVAVIGEKAEWGKIARCFDIVPTQRRNWFCCVLRDKAINFYLEDIKDEEEIDE